MQRRGIHFAVKRWAWAVGLRAASGLLLINCQSHPADQLSKEVIISRQNIPQFDPFTKVVGVVEMAHRRIAVADREARAIFILNLLTGHADTTQASGSGPNEFKSVDALYTWAADSLIIFDAENGRFAVIDPMGRVSRVFRLPMSAGLVWPTAAAQRFVYLEQGAQTPTGDRDSVFVIRWSPDTEKMDTMLRIKAPTIVDVTSTGRSGKMIIRNTFRMPLPFSPQDEWGLIGSDIAAIRAKPYALEWFEGRTRVHRIQLPERRIKVTREDIKQWTKYGDQYPVDQIPEEMPPFPAHAVVPSQDGRVWFAQNGHANTKENVYEVHSRNDLSEILRLPNTRTLLHVGTAQLYVFSKDESDQLWLEVYDIRK